MSFLRRAGPRFVVEALAIVAAAAITAAVGLRWWEIVLCVVVVLGAALAVEVALLGGPRPAPLPRHAAAEEPADVVAAEPPPAAPRSWNVWEIHRLLREHGDPDDERQFLLHYLRDYADADGVLPAEFDDLARESFGSLFAG